MSPPGTFPLELPSYPTSTSPSLPVSGSGSLSSSSLAQSLPPLAPQREPLPVAAYRPYSSPPRSAAERANAFLFRDPPEAIRRLHQPLTLVGLTGFLIGCLKGGRKASLIFTAENAHRKPQNKNQWYYYRKTKNYHIILGALPVAFSWAFRLSLITASFISLEYAFDKAWSVARRWQDEDALARAMVRDYGRGEEPGQRADEGKEEWWEKEIPKSKLAEHAASGAAAGAILGLTFSLWNRFYPPLTRKVVAGSLAVGGLHGLVYPLGRQAQLVEQRRLLDIHGPEPSIRPLPTPEQYAELERERLEEEEREFARGWREARLARWLEKGGKEADFERADGEVMRKGREAFETRLAAASAPVRASE